MIDTKKVARLRALATSIRLRDLQMIYGAKLGHIGGDFSATDILVALYFDVLRIDPGQPDDPERDRFILSKGHSAGALYTTLAHAGFFPLDELATFAGAHGGGTLRWITAASNTTAQRLYDDVATRTTWVTYEKET